MSKNKSAAIFILILLITSLSAIAYISYFSSKKYDETKESKHIQNKEAMVHSTTHRALLSIRSIGGGGLPVINVSEYEGENDTVKIQAALNDVPEGGAIVFIPSGVWVAAGLQAKSHTFIVGAEGAIIRRPENVTEPFLTFANISDFAVLNLTFEGENIENAYGIEVIDSRNFTIQNNTFYNHTKSAVKVTLSLNGTSSNFTISNNLFLNCQNVPIFIFGIPSRRAIRNFCILNNTLINGTKNGKIGIAFSANGTIENNKIINCQYGIATRCVSNLTIRKNYVENITDYGIYLGTQVGDPGTDNVKIIENEIRHSRIGICRYYGSYPLVNIQVINNLFVNSSQYDILADFPGTFINNTITDASKLKIENLATLFIGTRTVSGQIILPGDINHDLKINIIDVALVAISFGSSKGNPNWNEAADIIQDGEINIKDISYLAKNFGITS